MSITTYKGFDCSHWQGTINYSKVKSAGYKFVIAKCTEGSEDGTAFFDSQFKNNINHAKSAGLIPSAYHYFLAISETDARHEAQWFMKKLTGYENYLFCDVEDSSLTKNKTNLTNYLNAFFDELQKHGHKKLGIYASYAFFKDRLYESKLKSGLLKWVARYNSTLGRSADIWQYSSTGGISGISGNVDLNRSYNNKIITTKSSSPSPTTTTTTKKQTSKPTTTTTTVAPPSPSSDAAESLLPFIAGETYYLKNDNVKIYQHPDTLDTVYKVTSLYDSIILLPNIKSNGMVCVKWLDDNNAPFYGFVDVNNLATKDEIDAIEKEIKSKKYYTVKDYDTMSSISKLTGIDLSVLLSLNGISDSKYTINTGQAIRIN